MSWVTVLWEGAEIEEDLRKRATLALQLAGFGWADATFVGRDGRLAGRAANENEPSKALDIVNRVWGVRVAESRADLIEKVENYTWTAALKENRVKLTGNVPNDALRQAIVGVAQANFPKSEIDDRSQLARGVPDEDAWLGGISFGLKHLAALKQGNIVLSKNGLSITGEAENLRSYKSIKGALKGNLPQGVKLVTESVKPPAVTPYLWTAKLAANQLVLTGYVPDDSAREAIFTHAKKVFSKVAIVDRMEPASGAPEAWSAAAIASLDELAVLREGLAELRATQLSLSGEAPGEAEAESVRTRLKDRVPQPYRVTHAITFPKPAPPTVSPFVTTIDVSGSSLTLTGFVPGDGAREQLLAALKPLFPNRNIEDRLQLGSGAIEGWRTCLMSGASGLAKAGGGRAQLTDAGLIVTGTTEVETVAETLPAEIRAAANRSCETDVRVAFSGVAEPNLTWRAAQVADGSVVLEGDVIEGTSRSELVQLAAKAFPNVKVVDRMNAVAGSSNKWLKSASLGLEVLAQLRKGEAVLSNQDLLVRGEAKDASVATSVKEKLSLLPKGYTGRDVIDVKSDAMIWAEQEAQKKADAAGKTDRSAAPNRSEENAGTPRQGESEARGGQIDSEAKAKVEEESRRKAAESEALKKSQPQPVVPAPETKQLSPLERQRNTEAGKCQQLMREAAASGVIQFARASSRLAEESMPTIEQLGQIAKACPNARIAIEGHTDAEGAPEANLPLSQRRAQAVVEKLTQTGVASSRLTAVGFGETRPVASNDTPDGRSKNRRIEFTVTPN